MTPNTTSLHLKLRPSSQIALRIVVLKAPKDSMLGNSHKIPEMVAGRTAPSIIFCVGTCAPSILVVLKVLSATFLVRPDVNVALRGLVAAILWPTTVGFEAL